MLLDDEVVGSNACAGDTVTEGLEFFSPSANDSASVKKTEREKQINFNIHTYTTAQLLLKAALVDFLTPGSGRTNQQIIG